MTCVAHSLIKKVIGTTREEGFSVNGEHAQEIGTWNGIERLWMQGDLHLLGHVFSDTGSNDAMESVG